VSSGVGFSVQRGDPGQQFVGGASTVGGDEQVAPPRRWDLGDGPGQQLDVIISVVRVGGAGP